MTQIEWNQEALIAKYKQRLKSKIQNALIYIQDTKSMKDLIDQTVKINNRIYHQEKFNKTQTKTTQKSPQKAPNQ